MLLYTYPLEMWSLVLSGTQIANAPRAGQASPAVSQDL